VTILAVDTAGRRRVTTVLVSDEGAVLRALTTIDTTVGAALPRHLAELLRDDVTLLVAATGPGSYTGLRAGVAALLGVASVRRLPIHPAPGLEGPALLAGLGQDVRVLAEAGRGGVYTAVYRRTAEAALVEVEPAQRLTLDTLPEEGLPRFSVDTALSGHATIVDAAEALAAAIPAALARPPLDPTKEPLLYLTGPTGRADKARV